MNFDFLHTITYGDGTTLTPTNSCVGIELTKEEYNRLARALKENPVLDDREEIADLVARMKEKVIIADQWQNKNGSFRSTPLKKPRQITNISLSPRDYELKRIQKYPLELLDKPEETMTVIGSDGKELRYTYWFGRVEISAKNARTFYDADEFMRKFGNL